MMTLMVMVPMLLAPQQEEERNLVDLAGVKLYVYDADQGLTFRIAADGKVTLTITAGKGARKVYEAGSLDAFRKEHPQLFSKYRLDRHLPAPPGPPGGIEKLWRDLKNRRPEDWNPFGQDWGAWLEEQRKLLEELGRRFDRVQPVQPNAPDLCAPTFGIRVEAVGETLREQLSLKEGHGVLVSEVKPGSMAEKAGVQLHDVILELNGEDVNGKWAFRRDMSKALVGSGFRLAVLRGGKRQILEVKTGR